jgi:hypothetical protein
MIHDALGDLLAFASPGEDEVAQADEAMRDVMNSLCLQAEVAKNLPGLDRGEGVFDAGADLAVGGVVSLLPDEECT